MSRLRLSFKQKLVLGITAGIVAVFVLGGAFAYQMIQSRLRTQTDIHLAATAASVHALVGSLVDNSVKSYLKGISQANLSYVEYLHEREMAGILTERQAKAKAEAFFSRQKIGRSGYTTVIDNSDSKIRLVVHPYGKNLDISKYAFAREMLRQRDGYQTFEWKNPSDSFPRTKAQWMTYFAPWHWIIEPAPYRDEFEELVNLDEIERRLAGLEAQAGMVPFVMDKDGNLLIHSQWKGRKLADLSESDEARKQVQSIVRVLHQVRLGAGGQASTNSLVLKLRAAADQPAQAYVVSYRWVADVDWLVGIVSARASIEEPLSLLRHTFVVVLAGTLLLAVLVAAFVASPLSRSIDQLSSVVDNLESGRPMNSPSRFPEDETGRIAWAFHDLA